MIDESLTLPYQLEAFESDLYSVDHCPGIYVSSEYMFDLLERSNARDAGFSMGQYEDTPLPIVEGMSLLTQLTERRIAQLQEQEAKKLKNDG